MYSYIPVIMHYAFLDVKVNSYPQERIRLMKMPEHLWLAAPASIYINHNMAYHCSPTPLFRIHCTQHPVYVMPEKKLHGLVPNSYIHVSVNDLYIPTIGPPI